MLKLLQELSKRALLLNEFNFTEKQKQTKWLGTLPASDEEIESAKKVLQIDLPEDYIEFLKISNGFHRCTITGTTFLSINEIDYLINIDEDLVEIWNNDGTKEIGNALSQSILVAGLKEEQYFLLIPPDGYSKKWCYFS